MLHLGLVNVATNTAVASSVRVQTDVAVDDEDDEGEGETEGPVERPNGVDIDDAERTVAGGCTCTHDGGQDGPAGPAALMLLALGLRMRRRKLPKLLRSSGVSAKDEREPAIRGVLRRCVHIVWALALASIVLLPNLPTERFGQLPSKLAGWLRPVSFVQSWRMYAPDPQRSQTYMNLTAHYPGGREVELEETIQEKNGWTVTWAGQKTRVDIWRHYANFHGSGRNDNRTWYLRGGLRSRGTQGRGAHQDHDDAGAPADSRPRRRSRRASRTSDAVAGSRTSITGCPARPRSS